MKLSIYVGYHKPCDRLSDPVFKYLYLGAAVNGEKNYMPGTFRDDAGQNISWKNATYCENTGLYWIWKNDLDSDYIGFFHYRRHLSPKKLKFEIDPYLNVNESHINPGYEKKYGLTKAEFINFLGNSDVILPYRIDLQNVGFKNNLEQFEAYPLHVKEDLYKLTSVFKNGSEEHYQNWLKYLNSPYAYFYNMFIMRREIFSDYCEYLFPTLERLEQLIDERDYSIQQRRSPAFLTERIFGSYFTALEKKKTYKFENLQAIFIRNSELLLNIKDDGSIPVVMSCDDSFCKYLSVALLSMMENGDQTKNYTVYILTQGISPRNQDKVGRLAREFPNFKIKILNCGDFFERYSLSEHGHVKKPTYYRFCIPFLFKDFEKVVYIDSDTIILRDVYDLYNEDLTNACIGAALESTLEARSLRGIRSSPNTGSLLVKDYVKEYLDDIPLNNYIQAGVMVWNIKEMLLQKKEQDLLKHFDKPYWHWDQDIINKVFKDSKLIIDRRWNVAHGDEGIPDFYENMPVRLRDSYFTARKDPWIIHYAGGIKPWKFPDTNLSHIWWSHARKSPFYEEIIVELTRFHTPPPEQKSLKTQIKECLNPYLPEGSLCRKTLSSSFRAFKRLFRK